MRSLHILLAGAALVVVAGFAGLLIAWFVVETTASGHVHFTTAELAPAEAGLVLGTSPWLRNGRRNPYFDHRIAAAKALYVAGKAPFLVVSGNRSLPYDEPTEMRDALVAAGVPENKIYRDYAGYRTLDSVVRAKQVFGLDRVVVVSQRSHVARALFIARWHGLDFEGYAAPGVRFPRGLKTDVREVFARALAMVDAVVGRAPKVEGGQVKLGLDAPT